MPTNRLRLAGVLCVAAIATVAFVYLLVGGDTDQSATIANDVPTVVSAGELAGFARASGTDVYRAGAGRLQLEQPTSVYLAWRGVPSLVEVYAPTAAEARTVALLGRVRPVRG